ncbi:hypothetical protein ID866_8077 [Astraeus odoratus]|nr:hypothetical protein ID866_8077 [Astraeus odoratus]
MTTALVRRAADLYERYEHGDGIGTLEEAIALNQQVLELDHIGQPHRAESLDSLARCMRYRYESLGKLGDLEEAISLNQQALNLHPVGHPNRSSTLKNLADCLKLRCESQGTQGDLEEAMSLLQQALHLHPVSHPDRSTILNNLANCMNSRYYSQGALGDLEVAIALSEQALNICPVGHPDQPPSLSNLAHCLQNRYKSQGALGDLEDAISLSKQALELCPVGHPNRSSYLKNLAVSMHERHQSLGALADLEVAISLNQEALDLQPVGNPNRPGSISNLANCMEFRYCSQGALADLEEAISLNKQALDLCPVGYLVRGALIVNLAHCLQHRYKSQGALGDLEDAISLNKQALELCPVGHPNRSLYLKTLALSMHERHESLGALADLEVAISLNQEVLDLQPVGNPNRPGSISNLANCMEFRYRSQGALADLEDAISLNQQALDLCPVGYPVRERYESQGALPDLEVAISLNRQALDLRPVGHPNRSASLNNLASCMKCRYDSHGELADLEEAISLHQKALDLHPVHHPHRSSFLFNLADCMQSRYLSQRTLVDPSLSASIVPDPSSLVRNAMQDILHDIPPRLLQTNTGIILTQAQMTAHFCESTQFQTLVTFLQQSNDWLFNVKHMRATISDYFKYATLSHRWGTTEPSLKDILGNGSIYEISPTIGLLKLQKFCHTAAQHGYSWAWSDTCCIDKKNSVELQKAIGSMFLWYKKSALTIVYLSDISSSLLSMSLSGSEWFRRGWTLQELLAPNTMLFYTQEWLPYLNCTASNHKKDAHVLNELMHVTGILPQYLSDFHPCMDNARLRLQWAVGRHTTVLEDTAYSLFGLFNLHLPVLYGEGKEKSLVRLLQEILSQSHDISILHWVGEQSSCHSCFPANISSYQPLPCIQADPTSFSTQQSMSRIQQLISSDGACKAYNKLSKLPCAKFTDYILTLPCIVHHVQVVKLRHTYMDYHTYDVEAVGLRLAKVITPENLMESMQPIKSSYVLIRPWDRNLVNYLEEDHVMAGYKALMELERPFMALMLVRLPEGEYKRICTSCFIIVCPAGPASIANSETAVLDIV